MHTEEEPPDPNRAIGPTRIRDFSRIQKLTLLCVIITDFGCYCSLSVMAPFYPNAAEKKGVSETTSGMVFSFYALVMFIACPIFGQYLPKVGAKLSFLLGVFLCGTCNVLFGMLHFVNNKELFIFLSFFIRGCEALGASAYLTMSYVFVLKTFPNNIGQILGISETCVGLGLSVGPAIGGLLYGVGGYTLPFVVLGLSLISTVPICAYLLPRVRKVVRKETGSVFSLLKNVQVVILSISITVIASVWSLLDPTLEPHLRRTYGLEPEQVGFVFLLFSSFYGIFNPIWGWVADRIKNHWIMMFWGCFIDGILLLLIGPSPILTFMPNYLWLDLTILCCFGISTALALMPTFIGVVHSALNTGSPDNLETYSLVSGLWSCTFSLGEIIGPSLGGYIMEHYGFSWAATTVGLITLVQTLVIACFFLGKSCRRRRKFKDVEG